jgi:hypothetical protein
LQGWDAAVGRPFNLATAFSVTLAWLFHYLGQQPEVAQRIRTEVEAVLGEREPGLPATGVSFGTG